MQAGRTVVVTGASNGIGASLALHYAAPGVTLGLIGRNGELLEAVANACREKGASCIGASIDIRRVDDLREWLEKFDDAHPVDLLFANAGIAATRGPGDAPEALEELVAQADVNFRGTLVTAHVIAARMHARRAGQLALISSLNALFPAGEAPTYSATKAGILAYGRALHRWLTPAGVRVSVVCPGFVNTNLARNYTGPRPFQWEAAKAAAHIARALSRGRFFIAFPMPLVWGTRLSRIVPEAMIRLAVRPYRAVIGDDQNSVS